MTGTEIEIETWNGTETGTERGTETKTELRNGQFLLGTVARLGKRTKRGNAVGGERVKREAGMEKGGEI
jgi:hypothetical protein